ncbi:hypothetical protein JNB88_22315 [Rhizobium cauense]|uniref:hypothetical protein n=1 Tax=Rhizobium cauense TaxID=1166683 RepID=UPI001C6F2117|nr:hypothetical protein [Rhizobium cauense]MBW9116376.1 hypothetical protein [Rhizobium cauense]
MDGGESPDKTFNAAGQLTVQVTTSDDSTKVQLSYDPANAATWSTYQQNFNAAGQLTYINQTNDNGTRNTVTYDVANAATWSRYEQYIDGAGRVLYQTNYNDNGTWDAYAWDATNAAAWSLYIQSFNPAGQLTLVQQTNDDGVRYVFHYDPTNVQNWSRVEYTYDSAARMTVNSVFYDDGTRTTVAYDPSNSQNWSTVQYNYDAAGRQVSQVNNYDNGTRWIYTWDVTNVQPWSYVIDMYDAAGQRPQQNIYSDQAGNFTITVYEPNVRGNEWNRTVNEYINNVLRASYYYYDDGWYDLTRYSTSGAFQSTKSYNPHGVEYTKHNGLKVPNGSQHPVLLDLDADHHVDFRPINLADLSASTRFDWNGDGLADPTGWVGPNDGFLAIDLGPDGGAGGDGLIDQARELAFADWASDEQVAANGGTVSDLDGLRLVFDTNRDNILDANDARWSEFRVWRDANQNGVSDAGELMTMSEAGIKLINLLHTPEGSRAFADGSAITGTSTYETVNGEKYLVADATLAYRAA